MSNLRAFYAKTTELKNQFKLDFTFDSIDFIGAPIKILENNLKFMDCLLDSVQLKNLMLNGWLKKIYISL